MGVTAGPEPTTLDQFLSALEQGIHVDPSTWDMLESEAQIVAQIAASDTPAYGINTGLGSNLGYRLSTGEIAAFQLQLIEERAVAVGPPLWPQTGRAVLLARIMSAAHGKTGMSPRLFKHLSRAYDAGLSPLIPKYGSLGASDLTQTACWALGVMGSPSSKVSLKGAELAADVAFGQIGLTAPDLAPKDGLLLASQTGLSTALAAQSVYHARRSLDVARSTAALSMAGFAANTDILSADIADLSPCPHQKRIAKWFRDTLDGATYPAARIQDALSFRTVVGGFAAAEDALAQAEQAWETSFNTVSDSPAVIEGRLRSTAHFQSPALAMALEQVSLSLAMLAHGACQRLQKLMMPDLTGLPRFLAQDGGAAAGVVPVQKTAAALLADIRRRTQPVTLDPVAVSEAVEDMAPMTPHAALKLNRQSEVFDLLCATEAAVATRAIDLRGQEKMGEAIRTMHAALHQTHHFNSSASEMLRVLHDLCPHRHVP